MSNRISEVFPLQLLKWRTRRGLTTQGLAEVMDELGEPMHASAITKIEQGTRKVSLDEAFAFAAALNVPPVALLLPLDGQRRRVRVTSKSEIHPHLALDWIAGDSPLVSTNRAVIGVREWKEGAHHVRLYRELRDAQDAVGAAFRAVSHSEFMEGRTPKQAAKSASQEVQRRRKQYAHALEGLAEVLDAMEAAGIRSPEMHKTYRDDMAKLNLRTGA